MIPVVLLTGFLGSGKTTLLTRLLQHERRLGRRPAVLMNEFGAVGIDTALVGDAAQVRELLGGCICCSLQNDLLLTLVDLIEEHPERLYIETTGIADPLDVLDALTSPDLLRVYEVQSVIALVDAANWTRLSAVAELIPRQVAFADRILLNQVDRVTPAMADAVEAELRALNPYATLTRTRYAEADPEALLEPRPQHPSIGTAATRGLPPLSVAGYHTEIQRFEGPIDRGEFEAFLAELPPTVLRAKGFVRFVGDERTYLLQMASGSRRLYPFPVVEGTALEIVFIGH